MIEIKENIYCFQYMFFYIFAVFSLIYYLLLSKNIPNDSDSDYGFLIKAMDYWKKKPLYKMKAINVGNEKPKDMEIYSLGNWPGINQGCCCPLIFDKKNYYFYYKDICSQERLDNNCYNVAEQNSKNIYNYYFQYYVKYYDSDYLSLLSRVEKENNKTKCKKGFKKCGALDNFYRPFCVKEEEECVMNHFFFEVKNDLLYLYYGFNENLTENNIAVNNIFVGDRQSCIVDGIYLTDSNVLFKNRTKLKKCDTKNTDNDYISIYVKIPQSEMNKDYFYQENDIYKEEGMVPGEIYSGEVALYAMIYYGLKESMDEYYYLDAYIFKNIELFNLLIFIIIKIVIQLGYFIFIQKFIFKNRFKEIIYNIIWALTFIASLCIIWLFNNSIYRSSELLSLESSGDEGDNLFKLMSKLRIIDIVCASIVVIVHMMKVLFIIIQKDKKKFSLFINEDK